MLCVYAVFDTLRYRHCSKGKADLYIDVWIALMLAVVSIFA